MVVFLTGATGYIGSAVAEALIGAGQEVIGLARSDAAWHRLEQLGVRPYRGQLGAPGPVAEAAAQADAVIHTALGRDPNAPLADEAFVNDTLDALAGSGKAFVYTSGVWVMGNTRKDADEDSPPNPIPAVAWRAAVEKTVLEASGGNVRSIVIRPAMVYGRGGGRVAPFVQSARETGAALHVGPGDNHWSFVHVDDLAELYVLALEKAPPGTLLIGASGPAYRVREVAEAASLGAGAEGRTREWPRDEAVPTLGPWVDGLLLDQQISSRRATELLGWQPKAPSVLEELKLGSYRQAAKAGPDGR